MGDTKVNTFFVSEKISKVRWIPEQLKESDRFLTGSWDMGTNFVRIWRLHRNQYADDYNEYAPRCSDKIAFHGDISGMEFVTDNALAVSCSDGHVSVLQIKRAVDEDTLHTAGRSALLHKFNSGGERAAAAPCTALSVYGKDIATVGEDGRLQILDAGILNTPRRTIAADSCALTAVAFVSPQEVLTANRMGVIRMFDVRTAGAEVKPSTVFLVSCEDDKRANYVSCLASHPTQPHIVLTGSEEGSITVWDLRQPGYPASYLSAHTSAITEIGFHRAEPTKLFTTAECGELWLWAQQVSSMSASSGIGGGSAAETQQQKADSVNPWLNGERTKSRINVTSLISNLRKSINSFDAHGSKIICGSDSEALYFIDNIF